MTQEKISYNVELESGFQRFLAPVIEVTKETRMSSRLRKEIKETAKAYAKNYAAMVLENYKEEVKKMDFDYFCSKNKGKIHSDVCEYCKKLNVEFPRLASSSRKLELRFIRNVIWYVIIKEMGSSDSVYKVIGELFNRDRATIRASYKKTFDSVFIGDKLIISIVELLESE
tara:strand:- start:817 stop:1329 length:513 start_codon:yes stop_codon:yes gene_type:complete